MTNYESRMRARADALRARGSAVILSVESSCDETAVAVVENGRIERANAIATQSDAHALYRVAHACGGHRSAVGRGAAAGGPDAG